MARVDDFSASVLKRELEVGKEHLLMFGDLPTGDERGGHFWDLVRDRYDTSIDTGHLTRFEHYHPIITPMLEKDHQTRHAPPVIHVPPSPSCPPPTMAPEPSTLMTFGVGVVLVLVFSRMWKS